MILVRMIMHAKFGKGGELAKTMVETSRQMNEGRPTKGRVLTDLSGKFDTVVIETVHESLAAWEEYRTWMFSQPGGEEEAAMTDMIVSGHQEYYTIEAEM